MGKHAIVTGASMAGLMAAKVLAGHFEKVTVIERDLLPDGPEHRKGVPQAAHAHTLLIRGKEILEGLFPGLYADLLAHGAVESDSARDVLWHQHGVYKGRTPCGLKACTLSRPLLEWRVRTHLLQTPNVKLMQGHRVTGLLTNADQSRVTGVRVEPADRSDVPRTLEADMVVEAGGRGTLVPRWLTDLGYPEVPVTEIKTQVAYSSRYYRYQGPQPDFNLCILMSQVPGTRVGVLFRVEGGRWLLTLQTMLGEEPPTDEVSQIVFAQSLPGPQIAEFLARAEPDSPLVAHRTPTNLRRHYERMDRFPDGLAVLGDAATSFNPRYGQGMTTAALGAEALAHCLAANAVEKAGFSRRFQQELAKAITLPWQASTGEDFAYPQVEGKRPPEAGLINWYMRRVVRLSSVDSEALTGFLSVVHLLKPVSVLFKPGLVWRVLTQADGIR